MRRAVAPLIFGLTLIAATPAAFGGWAVISIESLPEYLVVGEPTTIGFTIRQHGQELMDDRSPRVIMGEKDGWFSRAPRAKAERRSGSAVYEASVTAREPGEVTITIDADYNRWTSTLLPIRVVAAGAVAAPLAAHERGRHLFVAKGCVTCHVKADDSFGEQRTIRVGPDLTNRSFEAEWLAQKLADPARFRAGTSGYTWMPNLGLEKAEIATLVSYLNNGTTTATAR